MTNSIWDYVTSISHSKKDIWNEQSETEYVTWTINKALSMHMDTVLYAQEMNRYSFLPKKAQYDYYINSLRASKRYGKWPKKQEDNDLDAVKEYYGYNDAKAKTALSLLLPDQISTIKKKLEKGGR